MNDSLSFHRDEFGAPEFRAGSKRLADLGGMLTADVQGYAPDALELLRFVEDVRAGSATTEEWEGNGYVTRYTAAGVHVQNLYVPDRATTYPLDEARAAILDYFRFLAPTPDARAEAIDKWEK